MRIADELAHLRACNEALRATNEELVRRVGELTRRVGELTRRAEDLSGCDEPSWDANALGGKGWAANAPWDQTGTGSWSWHGDPSERATLEEENGMLDDLLVSVFRDGAPADADASIAHQESTE